PLPTQEGPTDLYVQFVDAHGRVVGASTAARGLPAFATPGRLGAAAITTVRVPNIGEVRLLAQPVPNNGTMTLIVARSAASVSRLRTSLTRLLIGTLAGAAAALGVLIWVVVGRALRPVERMRRTADAIREAELDRRLDTPGTGDELDRLAETLNEML